MITDVLDRLGLDYEIRGDEAYAMCPQHLSRTGKEDANPSWSINTETGMHLCFSCGYKGSVTTLVADQEKISYSDAAAFVGENRPTMESMRKRLAEVPRRLLIRPVRFDKSAFYALPKVTEEMAKTRGLTVESCNSFDLRRRRDGWAIPIYAPNSELLGYQLKDGPYVRNLPRGMKKSVTLFGYNRLVGESPTVVVVESPLDAVLATQECAKAGLDVQAVATFGTKVSEDQLRLLRSMDPILAFDNDAAGTATTGEVSVKLTAMAVPHRVVPYPEGVKDFGDAPGMVVALLEDAIDPLKRKWEPISW